MNFGGYSRNVLGVVEWKELIFEVDGDEGDVMSYKERRFYRMKGRMI